MTAWYKPIISKLMESGLFAEVMLVGAKIRASLDEVRFLDVHYDPTSRSYSYAVIDLTLPYGGDKRVFGWDDYPHEGVPEIEALDTYPHHFHRREPGGHWSLEPSPMRGQIEDEMDTVIETIKAYLPALRGRETADG